MKYRLANYKRRSVLPQLRYNEARSLSEPRLCDQSLSLVQDYPGTLAGWLLGTRSYVCPTGLGKFPPRRVIAVEAPFLTAEDTGSRCAMAGTERECGAEREAGVPNARFRGAPAPHLSSTNLEGTLMARAAPPMLPPASPCDSLGTSASAEPLTSGGGRQAQESMSVRACR